MDNRGGNIPPVFFDNFISGNWITLADGPLTGTAAGGCAKTFLCRLLHKKTAFKEASV